LRYVAVFIYQNHVCRYYGVNDPVAEKLLKRAEAMPKLEPPDDRSITTLYIGNLADKVTENELRYFEFQIADLY
jgi:pre-mRNA-splicing factor RBM22/SLT11